MALENIILPCGVSEMENILQKLECPFTWAMEKITKELVDNLKYSNDDEEQNYYKEDKDNAWDHLFHLMKLIMNIYVETKAKGDSKEILNELKKCDDSMMGLKKYNHPEVSVDVVYFVLQSTQSFVFKELNLTEELNQTLREIKQDWKLNSKETSTLNACKSICWMHELIPVFETEHFIREAIKDNPNCEFWYYILGKNLRRKRRDSGFHSTPSKEEVDSFLKAYNMSAIPAYGIFVAHMYREMKRYTDAEKIYNEIFEQNPIKKPTILLRLALGFIYMRSFTKAKVCLDKVEAMQPHRSMFLHYRGIYHLHLKEYEEAARFFKEASSYKNIGAEKQYLECAIKLDKSFDIIKHLHQMLETYKYFHKNQLQQLLLDLALTYWKREADIPNALIYFLKAVESDPEAKRITGHVCKFVWIHETNIYQLLNREILPFVRKNKEKFEQSCIGRAEDLQKYCDQHFSKNVAKTVNAFSKFNLKTASE